MAFSINRATLLGNITRDPELRYTPGGSAVVKVGIATNHSYKNKQTDQWEDIPSFHNIIVWGKMAEFIANTYKKGDKLYVDGRINYGKYTNKNGQDVYYTEIIADNVVGMSGNQKSQGSGATNSGVEVAPDEEPPVEEGQSGGGEEVDVDDIPF